MKKVMFLLVILAIMQACSTASTFEEEEIVLVPITQFADSVIDFSSEYRPSPGSWSASKALGLPDVYPEYGDNINAWASVSSVSQDEFLSFEFDTAQYVNLIEVYETYNAGAVTGVSLRNVETGNWVPVFVGEAETDLPNEARIKTVSITRSSFLADGVKIDISSTKVSGWNEIDAVSVSGSYVE